MKATPTPSQPSQAPLTDAPGLLTDIRPPEDASLLPLRAFRPCGPTGFPARSLTPAAWWLAARIRRRLERLELFSRREYRKFHAGWARWAPVSHYLRAGCYQDRPVAEPVFFAQILGRRRALVPPDTADAPAIRPPKEPIGIYASSLGNVFMNELADALAASLVAAGARVVRGDERCPIRSRPGACIFVAPHEFFALGRGPAWARPGVLATAVTYGTEQVQTPWFWRGLPFVLASRGALDISWHTAELLSRALPSRHLTPGVDPAPGDTAPDTLAHPLLAAAWWRGSPRIDLGDDWAARPLDLVFFGGASPARDAFFARHAARLADYEAVVYLRRRGRGPVHALAAEGDLCAVARHACARSRLTLSVHRDAFGFFEWHRLVGQAMATGSVAVAEDSLPVPDFRPGEHYFCDDAGHLPGLVDWLLRDPDGVRAALACRQAARHLLASRCDPARAGRRVLDFLDSLGVARAG